MAQETKIRFDMETLNDVPFKDQITFEDYAGIPFTGIGSVGETPPARVVVGLLWLIQRRTDPTFTIEQALELGYNGVDMSSVNEADPTAAEPVELKPLRDKNRTAHATA